MSGGKDEKKEKEEEHRHGGISGFAHSIMDSMRESSGITRHDTHDTKKPHADSSIKTSLSGISEATQIAGWGASKQKKTGDSAGGKMSADVPETSGSLPGGSADVSMPSGSVEGGLCFQIVHYCWMFVPYTTNRCDVAWVSSCRVQYHVRVSSRSFQ